MKEQMYGRIKILREAGLIKEEVADICRNVVDMALKEKPDVDEDKLAMLVTHLAMGTQRVINGEEENPLQEGILEAIQSEPGYEKGCMLTEKLLGIIHEKIIISEFPQTEKDYLKLHLCNLFS